jgi:hypothetical protein
MLIFAELYFIAISIVVFLFGLSKTYNSALSIVLALFLSTVPLFWISDLGHIKLGGTPIFYLPFMFAGLSILFKVKLSISKKFKKIMLIAFIFISYSLLTTLYFEEMSLFSIFYWFSWVMNIIIFFSAVVLFSKLGENYIYRVLNSMVNILLIACMVGIFKYLSGISVDSNFIPVINRNATVVLVVMLVPIVFVLYEKMIISKKVLFIDLFILFIFFLLSFSRSGLLGYFFVILLYYIKINLKSIFSLIGAILISSIILINYSGDYLERFQDASLTIERLRNDEKFDSGMHDYSRVVLLESAFLIIKNNFFFGTGLGIENYIKEFQIVSDYHEPKRAHSFYISYFASLGLFGFSILILFMMNLYGHLRIKLFKISFLGVAFMMLMNEYILIPFLWLFFGMLVGIANKEVKW